MIQAISNQYVYFWEVHCGSINAETFKRFLNGLKLRIPENAVLVMDNARIHHSNIVQDFCAEENLRLLFLPPYSSFLNPIEYTFSKNKSVVRGITTMTKEEILGAIQQGIRSLTESDLQNYYLKTQNYFEKCFEREKKYY